MPDGRTRNAPEPKLVPCTLKTTLFFWWCAVSMWILTAIFAIGYLLTRPFRRTPEHFTWWAGTWGRTMFFFTGMRVRVTGLDRVDWSKPCVLAANHQNALDIPVTAAVLPVGFGFVAKAALEHVPFLGSVLKRSPSVFVDGLEPRRSLESLRTAGARIRSGCSVLVFPEGARSYHGRVIEFQRGAFLLAIEAGVPMVPVTIIDAVSVFNEHRHCAWPGTIHVEVGEPIEIEGLTRKDVPEIMARIRAGIVAPLPEAWRNPPTAAR